MAIINYGIAYHFSL